LLCGDSGRGGGDRIHQLYGNKGVLRSPLIAPKKFTVESKGESHRYSLSAVRNVRSNAALHKAEIAVASHKAAEIE